MKTGASRLLVAAVLLSWPVTMTLAGDGKADVVGTIWHYELSQGKTEQKGQFRVFKHEVFHGGKKIGVVNPKDKDETTLEITGSPELNGKATLVKTKQQPPKWKGNLQKSDGTTWAMVVIIKDR